MFNFSFKTLNASKMKFQNEIPDCELARIDKMNFNVCK